MSLWVLYWLAIALVWVWILTTAWSMVWPRIRSEAIYRSEKQWVERDPIGYIRMVLGVGPEVTDEEIEYAVTVEMPKIMRASGISAAEATEAFASIGKAMSDG